MCSKVSFIESNQCLPIKRFHYKWKLKCVSVESAFLQNSIASSLLRVHHIAEKRSIVLLLLLLLCLHFAQGTLMWNGDFSQMQQAHRTKPTRHGSPVGSIPSPYSGGNQASTIIAGINIDALFLQTRCSTFVINCQSPDLSIPKSPKKIWIGTILPISRFTNS